MNYDLPEWLDWDRDGVIDFDQEDSNTFDQDNNRIADWLEEGTEQEWEYNKGTGWDYVGKEKTKNKILSNMDLVLDNYEDGSISEREFYEKYSSDLENLQKLYIDSGFDKQTIEDITGTRNLKYGDTGRDVIKLQAVLKYLGLNTNGVNGIFGDSTRSAVKALQKYAGIKEDEIVGNIQTRPVIGNILSEVTSYGKADIIRSKLSRIQGEINEEEAKVLVKQILKILTNNKKLEAAENFGKESDMLNELLMEDGFDEGMGEDDNGVDLKSDIYGLGSPEGEDYYIKVGRTKITTGDLLGSADVSIVHGQINNVGGENANLDFMGSFVRVYGGVVTDKQKGFSGEFAASAYAAIIEGQVNIDLKGKNTQTTIGFAPSGGSTGGHFKLGRNYYDEQGTYHKFNLELGGALGIGGIAEIDITNQGHGLDIQDNIIGE